MKNFKDFSALEESHAEVDKHVSDFAKSVKSSSAQPTRLKRTGEAIPNMKHVTTDASHQEIFNHLKKMGYNKTSGWDNQPNEFTLHHNRDEMRTVSDSVHHSSGVSAHIEHEHGSKAHVHFFNRKMKEELGEAHKLGDKVIINKGPSYVVGKTGHIGEIRRHYIGAPKTYTIDHDDGSIQLKSTHFRAVKEEVEEIDELSSDLLKQYKKNASDAATAADKAGKYDIGHKRFKGILKATFKQFANDAKKNG